MHDIVLVHSPLLGASSWKPTARALRQLGWLAHVPTPSATDPSWRDWAAELAREVPSLREPVLVGHSAAGLLLPSLARPLDASALIFADARIPPAGGMITPAEPEFLQFLRGLVADDGRMPPWSRWWGDDVAEELLPDGKVRAQFEADLPRLPLSWFEDNADVPIWENVPAGYLQLSKLYDAELHEALRRGWPVRHLDGTHVHPVIDPEATAEAIAALIDAVLGPR